MYQHRQIVDLAFKMNKIKTKYNALAQCTFESLSLSTALLAIYQTLAARRKKPAAQIAHLVFAETQANAGKTKRAIF